MSPLLIRRTKAYLRAKVRVEAKSSDGEREDDSDRAEGLLDVIQYMDDGEAIEALLDFLEQFEEL